MSVRIIVDSSADLTPEIKERLTVIPMVINFGDEEFVDGVTINHKEFYEKLTMSDTVPTTSQVTPATYEQYFNEVSAAGDSAVVITLASKLSGTYQSVMIAVGDYENIYIVDSESATIGSGILAELALRLVDAGKTAQEIAEILEAEKKNVFLFAMVDTLEYLKRGGRVSKTAAFAGGLLNIKPIISLRDGEINILGKARGLKQAMGMLIEEVGKSGGIDYDKPLLFGYTGNSNLALNDFMNECNGILPNNFKPQSAAVGSVIGTHAGPGAITIAFFKK